MNPNIFVVPVSYTPPGGATVNLSAEEQLTAFVSGDYVVLVKDGSSPPTANRLAVESLVFEKTNPNSYAKDQFAKRQAAFNTAFG